MSHNNPTHNDRKVDDDSPSGASNLDRTLSTLDGIVTSLPFSQQKRIRADIAWIKKRQSQRQAYDRKLLALVEHVHAQTSAQLNKKDTLPEITFPEQLPISSRRDDIGDAISEHQVVIVAGETGSGKTTQLPKICLSRDFGLRGRIAHTQPRRIAARTVASRIAEELNVELGTLVGYQVRFTDQSNDTTLIKLMTDGILLAEIQRDPMLWDYEVIIVDEAHERSLNIDFILGYLKGLLPKRPDLKVIVTSATIDVDRFSKHFDNAPVIEVSGRTFPVELRYRPWIEASDEITGAIVDTLREILQQSRGESGDTLVFLSGERDIRETSLAIKKANIAGLDVLALYARLSLSEQNKIFQSHKGRRVILSTNVAETSVTVPGIRYVIDTGYARISRYSLRTKVQRLPIEAISQASANQRAGRCGRVREGICYRLYSEEDFLARPEFTDAELLRTNLAAVVLQMLQLNIGRVEDFPFVDRPDSRLINDGYKLLEELGAVSSKGKLLPKGHTFSNISLDPRFACMLIEAEKYACLSEVLIIVTALTVQDPRERPNEKRQAADEKHRRFADENSDFMAYINLWNYVESQRQELSQNQFRRLCKKDFLIYLRIKEWRDLHYQITVQIKKIGMRLNREPAQGDCVHRALLPGLLSNVAKKSDEDGARDYIGTRSRKFMIFPGSSLRKKKLPWLMAADFIETSQLFAHCVARVDPKWILDASQHLVKRHYFEPHYDPKSGSVKCFVKISLWGLILAEKQRVDYSKIDPDICYQIFIRSAFVEGRYRGRGHFFKKNTKLIENIVELEAKARRRDILVDDETVYNFYHERVPNHIINISGFEHWRKNIEQSKPDFLVMTDNDLMLHNADTISEEQYPSSVRNGDLVLPATYVFEPTRENDGLNVTVPVDLLHQLDENALQWLVPGMLTEKCIAMVKALAKQQRKHYVPVPTVVERALARVTLGKRSLYDALAEALNTLANTGLKADDWQLDKLEPYYFANIVIVDTNGGVIDQGRDIFVLRERYRDNIKTTLENAGSEIERSELHSWDFDALEKQTELKRGVVNVKAFPALSCLSKKHTHAAIKLYDNPIEAAFQHQRGVCILALAAIGQTAKYARKQILAGRDLGLTMVNMGTKAEVVEDILLASVRHACFGEVDLNDIRDRRQFEECINRGKSDVVRIAEETAAALASCLKQALAIKKYMKSSKNALAMTFVFADIQKQLDTLFSANMYFNTHTLHLKQYPRYLDAILLRLEKAAQKPQAERSAMLSLQNLWQCHEERLVKLGRAAYYRDKHWQEYRWLLEELRVSFFAQALKTRVPVSEKRLKKQWQLVLAQ